MQLSLSKRIRATFHTSLNSRAPTSPSRPSRDVSRLCRRLIQHGIAPGPWEAREHWINDQIAVAWKDRGAFPGLGSALEALGMPMGTAIARDLLVAGEIAADRGLRGP